MWRLRLVAAVVVAAAVARLPPASAGDDLRDFDFSAEEEERETLVAQESRAVIEPAPGGVTNSHRPQYSVDSYARRGEEDRGRASEVRLREAVVRALERKEHARKFAQVLPIVRAMSSSQRGALAALVAGQLAAPALSHRRALTLHQVRSMYGTQANATSDLMLPILLDMANLFRRAARPTKQPRAASTLPPPSMLRRSIDDLLTYDEDERVGVEELPPYDQDERVGVEELSPYDQDESVGVEELPPEPATSTRTAAAAASGRAAAARALGGRSAGRNRPREPAHEATTRATHLHTSIDSHHHTRQHNTTLPPASSSAVTVAARAAAILSVVHAHSEPAQNRTSTAPAGTASNATLDQTADSSKSSLAAEQLPVADRLRARYKERKVLGGKPARRRPAWSPRAPGKPPLAAGGGGGGAPPSRRGEAAAAAAVQPAPAAAAAPAARRRPAAPAAAAQASPADPANCELFTNSLCLEAEDYPTEAIVTSLRRNKAAAGALLADYREQAEGAGAVDGVSPQQEATYTAEHYLHANRRGDRTGGSVRDFAGAGEAGFMCPSTVKYARPQRARATSGTWKYIVNTGEHTQTLRLEKCLKPKESCTYLTDNFKSKCVQVYNYHRLLTWDQQNGLHMDIFKVPTCCSCHIEGYSVAFPPVGHRAHETSSERFPGQDLSHEAGGGAFDSALGQSGISRPTLTKTASFLDRPSDNFGSFGDSTNSIPGAAAGFGGAQFSDEDLGGGFGGTGPIDSYGNYYYPDSSKQASVPVRSVKKPPRLSRPSPPPPTAASGAFDSTATLPSYLEPPVFFGTTPEKFKYSSTQYKRTKRPSRRPIRKTASGSGVGVDLLPSGSSNVEAEAPIDLDDLIADFDEFEPHRPTKRIASPPVAATTEAVRPSSTAVQRPTSTAVQRPTPSQADRGTAILKDISLNKRVNYNYHPIIDFFESSSPGGGASDRDDSISTLGDAGVSESDWKPMSHPLVRTS